uniref:Uncharacterized protein n=1 Tax=Arundo donax TaxID=35708 RepID=A0A0A9FZR9_ARUDO
MPGSFFSERSRNVLRLDLTAATAPATAAKGSDSAAPTKSARSKDAARVSASPLSTQSSSASPSPPWRLARNAPSTSGRNTT